MSSLSLLWKDSRCGLIGCFSSFTCIIPPLSRWASKVGTQLKWKFGIGLATQSYIFWTASEECAGPGGRIIRRDLASASIHWTKPPGSDGERQLAKSTLGPTVTYWGGSLGSWLMLRGHRPGQCGGNIVRWPSHTFHGTRPGKARMHYANAKKRCQGAIPGVGTARVWCQSNQSELMDWVVVSTR